MTSDRLAEQPGEAAVKIIDAIRAKSGALRITFGYHPNPDGTDPGPGEPTTWWASCFLPDGRRVERRFRGVGEYPMIEALAQLAEAVGVTVRIRYEEG